MGSVRGWVKKDSEQRQALTDLLSVLLVEGSDGGKLKLPTLNEYILSETVNGTLAYLGGGAGEVQYGRFPPEHFEMHLWDRLSDAICRRGHILSQEVREGIKSLAHSRREAADGPDRPSITTHLYNIYATPWEWGLYQKSGISSTWKLPDEFVANVRSRVLPSFEKESQEQLKLIGGHMRPYVRHDVCRIRKTYQW